MRYLKLGVVNAIVLSIVFYVFSHTPVFDGDVTKGWVVFISGTVILLMLADWMITQTIVQSVENTFGSVSRFDRNSKEAHALGCFAVVALLLTVVGVNALGLWVVGLPLTISFYGIISTLIHFAEIMSR